MKVLYLLFTIDSFKFVTDWVMGTNVSGQEEKILLRATVASVANSFFSTNSSGKLLIYPSELSWKLYYTVIRND